MYILTQMFIRILFYNIIMRNRLVMFFTFLWFCIAFNAYGSDFTAERIQKAYEGIKDIKGSFVQKSHIKDLKKTETYNGTFMIKMPSKIKWQYSGGNKQQNTEVIINGDEMIIYQKNEKQAFKSRFDRETYGQSPIALLSGFGSLEKEFDVVSGDGKLILKPKKPMGNFASIQITPSEDVFPISSLTIIDRRSNRIDITFRDVDLNVGLKDTVFDFSLPKGASMYEYSKP